MTQKLAVAWQAFLIENPQQSHQVGLHDWFIYDYARLQNTNWIIDNDMLMLCRQHDENVVGANVDLQSIIASFKKMAYRVVANTSIMSSPYTRLFSYITHS